MLSILVTYFILQLTPLKGKLGFTLVFIPLVTAAQYFYVRLTGNKKAAQDIIASAFMLTGAAFVFIPVLSLLVTTFARGIPGLHLSLFTSDMKTAAFGDDVAMGGLLHSLLGTIFLILLTMVISVPLGIFTALYLTEIRGFGSNFIQFMVQAMSGIPSVVAGLFIFSSVILLTPLKASSIVGAFALSILMTPTVTRTAQEVLLLIPNELREAGLALGATQWRTVAMIVVPAAKSGLMTAVILGVARIAGETAPLLFTIGGADQVNANPFSGFNSALPLYIWKGFQLGTPEAVQRSWSGILILLILVLTLFVTARTISLRGKK